MFRKSFLFLACAVLLSACCSSGDGYRIKDGVIVFDEPAPANGQEDMLLFAADPIDTVRTGFIGLGMRGPDAVRRFTYIDGAKVVALCDLEADRVAKSQEILAGRGKPAAAEYSGEDGWKQLCERDDIDLVYICTNWQTHVEMAVYAMECGKHVAVEVPAAMSVAECWRLVDTSERTRKHCMMLENCVYDFFELTCLNMAQQGLFGEVLHAEGAYIHNLEPFWDYYHDNWRLDFNQKHSGDVYATHGFGPDCQVLNIHRGDKLEYLVSMDTKSVVGLEVAKEKMGVDTFANGDQTSTLVKTRNGKTILVQHNVYTPRPYDRMYQLVGTKGFADKYPNSAFAFEPDQIADAAAEYDNLSSHSYVPREVRDSLMAKYKHPIAKEIEEKAREVGGHGGMDFIMDYRLVWCLRNGKPLDMDVYDAAEWSCLGELTAASIANGSKPVKIPDFTRGRWNKVDGLKLAE
ncbi:MAG: Gfo/Idh/MocA family oxidoreductase [Bacteroidales bacterium]|nr:Gfo/Idh/MocA family oxidoreductase [Bacteroidales bacterium]MDD7083594.1 Gfo/Idh/MocA family oxidoreductase [Bacteroidales bacterium]MDY5262240.1 Gfo/Idh/MocA family oxidoreductase [Candidatus Cryptobacteroides sp.]MDY5569688.1 Gfo/Idh/MocA family oxidoreductase [Candidatus Cryptobacteroides sp.]